MMKPVSIPLHVEQAATSPTTGNALPLLHEIRHALAALAERGETRILDLRAIPMAPGDEARIDAFLGKGEVSAKLDALGRSEIYETRFAGVWRVTHYNERDEMIGRFVEITAMPAILQSQPEDVQTALAALGGALAASSAH